MTIITDRDLILQRIRSAIAHSPEPPPIPRTYAERHYDGDLVELLAENLTDYRAHVHRADLSGLPALVSRLVGEESVAVPEDLPAGWIDGTNVQVDEPLCDAVVTGCALAIAETGTIVLDAGMGQGRRALTLIPDHHICVVRVPDQVVAALPEALTRLDARRPLTWISGPSATSDIELDRVEGVHGPRTLDVILLAER